MPEQPAAESPFRGGFRLEAVDAQICTVDAWGSDVPELLSRAVEGAWRAAGAAQSLRPAPPFRLEARGADVSELVGALTVAALGLLAREGRYAVAASCRSFVSVAPGGKLDPGVAATVLCDGGFVNVDTDAGLRRVAPTDDPVGVWEEGGILRARFHVMERPPDLLADAPAEPSED